MAWEKVNIYNYGQIFTLQQKYKNETFYSFKSHT